MHAHMTDLVALEGRHAVKQHMAAHDISCALSAAVEGSVRLDVQVVPGTKVVAHVQSSNARIFHPSSVCAHRGNSVGSHATQYVLNEAESIGGTAHNERWETASVQPLRMSDKCDGFIQENKSSRKLQIEISGAHNQELWTDNIWSSINSRLIPRS